MAHHSKWFHYTSNELSGYERLKVDVAQTGFFEGREFRTFKELSIAASGSYVIRVTVPLNIILSQLNVNINAGELRVALYVGGTPGGTFSEVLPVVPANNMSLGPDHRLYAGAAYVPQVAIAAGGTHTGGTQLDVLLLKANSNNNQATSVGSAVDDSRGVGAATYYYRLTNLSATDAVTGVLSARWEERP